MLGVQVLFLFELAKSQYCIRLKKKTNIEVSLWNNGMTIT
jgi:hypothetical protein